MTKITYIEKGIVHDFKRVDTEKTVVLYKTWKAGNLIYGYKDRFNVVSIAAEDILKIETV